MISYVISIAVCFYMPFISAIYNTKVGTIHLSRSNYANIKNIALQRKCST